jgi:putative ABC transport system permease protein
VSLTGWDLKTMRPGRLRVSAALAYYFARLRRRWIQELLAVCGIAAGVALLYATQVASTSLTGPVQQITQGLVGTSQLQLLARGAATFPEATYEQIVRTPGVVRAAPVLQVPGSVAGPKGQTGVTYFGADPRVVKLRGSLLQGFSINDAARQETVVLPRPVARKIGVGVGDDMRVEVAGRSVTVPGVVAGSDQIGSLTKTSIALVPLAYLQRLTGTRGRVSRVLVQAEPGKVDEVRRRLGAIAARQPADVRPATYETTLYNRAAKPWKQSSAIFSALSALVGWLFAVCALLITAAERRGLAREQHELGYPPRATFATFLLDAGVVGVIGVAVGLVAGEALSRRGFETDLGFLAGAFPIGDQRVVTWQSVAIAAGGGLLAAVIGVLGPLPTVVGDVLPRPMRRMLRRGRREGAQEGRWSLAPAPLAGLAILAGAIAITIWAPGAAVVGLLALGLSLVLLLPSILDRTVAALAWANERQRSSIPAVLALQQLRSSRWRTRALAITTTGAVAVFGATALQGGRANLQTGLAHTIKDLADVTTVWADAPGAGSVFGTTAFPARRTDALAALPEVKAVRLYRAGLLDVADRRAWLIGQPRSAAQPIPSAQVLEGDAAVADRRIRAGGWVAVSRVIADALELKVGESVTLPTPRPLHLRVAAITTNLGWTSGTLLLNADDFRRASANADIAAYHVDFRPGVTLDEGRRAVAAGLGRGSPLVVESAASRVTRQVDAVRGVLSRLREIAQLTLLAAILAMGAAMTALLWQHRPVVAELKLNGLSTGLMWRALIVETAVLLGTGMLAGGLFGLLGQVLCTRGIVVVTGSPVIDGLRLGIAAGTVGAVLAVSVTAVAVPGYAVARVQPDWDE